MDAGEWSDSGSDRFISDAPNTEVLGSLDATAVITLNYSDKTRNNKIGNERIRE
jgi:hypothetical protein